MNDDHHAAIIYASMCVPLRPDLVYSINILKIIHARVWKLRSRSWMRKGEDVVLY